MYAMVIEKAMAGEDRIRIFRRMIAAEAAIDKAASKGVYHKNNAARKVSRLAQAVNKVQ